MNTLTGNPALDDPAVAASLADQAWVELHVPRFGAMESRYKAYKTFLLDVLTEICNRTAPLGIVQARSKGMPSFAEKILRKRKSYVEPTDPLPPDPLVRLTDLCGGRVITQTSAQVQAVCQMIQQCFDIDWANSDDASARLKTTEFGYRTINLIVMPNPKKLKDAGILIDIPEDILGSVRPETPEPSRLKAEVQVRTLLEHAYADIGHDLTYKTEVKVPNRIHRSFSAVAAMLETADKEFGRLVESLDDFKSNFGAYHTRAQVQEEIARLRIVLSRNPENVSQAVRIAQLSLAIGDHASAIDVLNVYRSHNDQGVEQALGTALTNLHWDTPRSKEFIEGRNLLEAACKHGIKDAELLGLLAECWAHLEDENQAKEYFRQALAVDATEPRSLCGYIEFQVKHNSNDTVVRIAEPMIRNAMERCRTQIEGRVNLPNAWSSLAIFRLLVGEPFEALDALAHLVDLCDLPCNGESRPRCAIGRAASRLLATLSHLQCIRNNIKGFDWLERATLLGLAVRVGDSDALAKLREKASWGSGKPVFKPRNPIVILSGGCSADVEPFIPPFQKALIEGAKGLSLALVSGGGAMGISGIAGAVASHSNGSIQAIGYLPDPIFKVMSEMKQSTHFNLLYPSSGTDFTPMELLQGWTDLIAAGVDPARVKILAYAGGLISKAECAIALMLGARVGAVDAPDLPKEQKYDDPDWTGHKNFLPLPLDAMTLHAFLRIETLELSQEDKDRLELAAKQAHENYVKSAVPKEPSLLPWNKLDPSLKMSNYHQVAFWEMVLRDFGLGVRPLTKADKIHPPLRMEDVLDETRIEKLAQMEHGRWNVERLGFGWRYAREKDVLKRLSPYLIPWQKVPPEIQKYDLNAIRDLPRKLREIELELFKI